MFKRGLMIFLALVMVLIFAAAAQAAPRKDKENGKPAALTDIDSHWAKQPIQVLASKSLIMGYPDLTFRPNSSVSNFEAIMMICRAAGFEEPTIQSEQSTDNKFPEWMQDCIDFALDEGILLESELDDIRGNQAAKRYQVAIWFARAMGIELEEEPAFEDKDEIPDEAKPAVCGMAKHGLMIGFPGNVFQPNKALTRAELAMVVYRIMEGNDGVYEDALQIETLTPEDVDDDVNPETDELTVKFNLDIKAVDDLDAVKDGITVLNVTNDEEVGISDVEISGDTLTITLEGALENDKTYRITVEDDLIQAAAGDEVFAGISGSEWEFTTEK